MLVGVCVAGAGLAMQALLSPSLVELGQSFLICAAVIGAVWLASRKRLREAARLRGDTSELLFVHRFELERRSRAMSKLLVVNPLVLLGVFVVLRPMLTSPRAWSGFALLAAAMLGSTLYVALVRRPRIQREIEQLRAEAAT